MIVVVASRFDTPARRLVERWAGETACLFTPRDLSTNGWRYCAKNPLHSVAILGGREVKQSQIRGVLTRLQWVRERELLDVIPEDRAYVAAEMSAFLLCWLAGLTCPVLNRPTPTCLTGPGWSSEQWNVAASKAGMRVKPARRQALRTESSTRFEEVEMPVTITVTVAGDRCLGNADTALLMQARRLADIAELDFLAAQFSGSDADAHFVRVVSPDLDLDGVADAALSCLLSA